MFMRYSSLTERPLWSLALVSLLALAACGEGETESPVSNVFILRNSAYAVAGNAAMVTEGPWLFFLADEAASGAQDLNNDGQAAIDSVAIVVNMPGNTEKNLGVAATKGVWVGTQLYIVVDEILDGRDHGGAATATDLVLMNWNNGLDDPVFVQTLDRTSRVPMVSVGTTLFFASAETPVAATESSIYAIDKEFPLTPRPVFTQDSVNPLSPQILGEQDGLIFLGLDETREGIPLNGDGNADDRFVLALLDGTGLAEAGGYNLMLRNTELAVSGVNSPMRAVSTGANDWLFGFLVDEASQEENLNIFTGGSILPPSWESNPSSPCLDVDMTDEVLHGIRFSDWEAGTMVAPANTGIAGGVRVLIAGDALGTIASEADENNCVLNNDGDFGDSFLRWIRLDFASFPYSNAGPNSGSGQMLALDVDLPGPAMAVAELDGAFVIQCDEGADGRNHDNNAGTNRDLIAWLDPQDASPAWRFNHGTSSAFYATATWMGEQPQRTRLGIAFAESSNGVDLNDDGDMMDSMPTWADTGGSPRRMSFLGRFLATDKDNAGITLANGYGFFRLSEAEDGADSNGNGNMTDTLLVRVAFSTGEANQMGTLNILERVAIDTDRDGSGNGGAFLFQENLINVNLNGDGDTSDFVVRFFRLP